MSLYLRTTDYNAMAGGKSTERKIQEDKNSCMDRRLFGNWELVYRDPLTQQHDAFRISALTVNDEALWGRPDLVYRDRKTKEILIVEIKVSNRTIPTDGWPNLRAQLWAYSFIDKWIDAPAIRLAGEVWTPHLENPFRQAVLQWRRDDPVFDKQNRELFALYGGKMTVPPATKFCGDSAIPGWA